jgi:hypothetical protein
MEGPQTRYVDVGGAEVVYQVVGQGPSDVVYVSGFANMDLRWDNRLWATFLLSPLFGTGEAVDQPKPMSAVPTRPGRSALPGREPM